RYLPLLQHRSEENKMMKLVILAGGLPSSINEESQGVPKPMVDIGGKPLLWHIMKYFAQYGIHDFIICAGYKSDLIKQYFMNYYIYRSDITVNLAENKVTIHNNKTEPWDVTVLDTGLTATTAARVWQVKEYVGTKPFLITYGDCLSDISVRHLLQAHSESGHILTVAVARPTGRNTVLQIGKSGEIENNALQPGTSAGAWVNACTMVTDNRIFHYVHQEQETFEKDVLNELAENHEATAYFHSGFWCPVETVRDRNFVTQLWDSGAAPWKIWKD
ncbi:MAG: NTP transferase domain-containing protein, partial [Oscillospiraceae bacterium]|nr:NTP transferase domain-containing protein [Oscillospiraceae bacterium]